jgi:hypothetical protein
MAAQARLSIKEQIIAAAANGSIICQTFDAWTDG